ncbi:hypothetical protein AB0L63_21285 [Nocardia sp. NPDC051990]|uniref:hypothetical protein n=1 Tax=Nocardia sp. NPDC051990 TaxID=3155285 RepID=UPI0034314148
MPITTEGADHRCRCHGDQRALAADNPYVAMSPLVTAFTIAVAAPYLWLRYVVFS